ncbi:helix-turn-helix domain-containing protein [Azospirillum doebereinerae]|uniref:helix-turn-helix domain-containing protein n=1 Tax=Azospirillum doebereinerae TaxID=92933 RepID=UPI001EE60E05|nr:helix-turn-helix transcriptional regulator [Azospirillum doebereinerae]
MDKVGIGVTGVVRWGRLPQYILFWDYPETGLVRRPVSANRLPFVKSVHSPAYRVLVDALVEARKTAGLTQQDLAHRLGKPQSFVAKVENRERRLDVVEFITLSRAVGLDPQTALRRVEDALPVQA